MDRTVDSNVTRPLMKNYVMVNILSSVFFHYFSKENYCFKSFVRLTSNIPEIKKMNIVEHLDDLQYIFTSTNIPQTTDEFSAEGQIVTKYTHLLSSFAKYG